MAEDNFGMELIPRKIHYCWFGGSSINKKNQKCMESWKKFCGDYEIVCWDESNCDIRKNKYVFEAYKNKKWAFVSDYFRLEALYNFGGIYLDTDVELTKPLDAFLDYSGFIGFEDNENIATCVIGGKKGHIFFDKALSVYENRCFLTEDGKLDTTTNVKILTEMLIENGLITDGQRQQVLNMEIFPSDFFFSEKPCNWENYNDREYLRHSFV